MCGLLVTFAFGIVSYSFVYAATPVPVASLSPEAARSPQPGLTPEQFAALPSLDLEIQKGEAGGASVKVGDQLVLKAPGAASLAKSGPHGSASQWKLEIPPGSSPLSEQGWAILSGGEEFKFIVVPLKAGELLLPALALQDSEGRTFARTNPLRQSVVSSIRSDDPKPQEPAAVRPPVSLVFPWWVLALAGVLVLLAIGAAIYGMIRWSRKNRKAAPVQLPPQPVLPEDEIALLAFQEVEKEGSATKGHYKKHYFRISEILKAYVGARYGFDALESTSGEIILSLEKKSGLPESLIDALEELFGRLDLVKFTDHAPTLDDSHLVMKDARAFVLSTRRVKQEAADAVR
jgi:hypothetical protein